MDFVRLNAATYIPDKLIEGYISLVWAERFPLGGDFELKTYDLSLGDILPEFTLVSHLDTQDVYMVETLIIEDEGEGADAVPVLTITGRSAAAIIEDRFVNSNYQTKRRMRMKYTATSALCVLLYQAVNNASGKDLTRGDTDPSTALEYNDYSWNTTDVIPNSCVTETVASEGATYWWTLEAGLLGPQFEAIMKAGKIGLRALRPVPSSSGSVISVNSSLGSRGTVNRNPATAISKLQFNLYSGVDKSATVKLSSLQGHLEKPQYLRSIKDHKSYVETLSGNITVPGKGMPGVSGWRKRVAVQDGGSIELRPKPVPPSMPKWPWTAAQMRTYVEKQDAWSIAYAKWEHNRDETADAHLGQAQRMADAIMDAGRPLDVFAAEVSELSPYRYKTHYDLGDTISLNGEYNKSAKMIVSEYVRTEDATGDRGIPGLIEP